MRIAFTRDRPLHHTQVSSAPHEAAEQRLRMWAELGMSMQWLSAECARIVHTLCHGEASNSGGDATEVLSSLYELRESLYGMVEYSRQLFLWQDVLQVCHTSRCCSLSLCVRTGWHCRCVPIGSYRLATRIVGSHEQSLSRLCACMLHGIPGVPCPTGRAGVCGATGAAD